MQTGINFPIRLSLFVSANKKAKDKSIENMASERYYSCQINQEDSFSSHYLVGNFYDADKILVNRLVLQLINRHLNRNLIGHLSRLSSLRGHV